MEDQPRDGHLSKVIRSHTWLQLFFDSSHHGDSANYPTWTRFSFLSLFLIFLKSHWLLKKKGKKRTHKRVGPSQHFKDSISERGRHKKGGRNFRAQCVKCHPARLIIIQSHAMFIMGYGNNDFKAIWITRYWVFVSYSSMMSVIFNISHGREI